MSDRREASVTEDQRRQPGQADTSTAETVRRVTRHERASRGAAAHVAPYARLPTRDVADGGWRRPAPASRLNAATVPATTCRWVVSPTMVAFASANASGGRRTDAHAAGAAGRHTRRPIAAVAPYVRGSRPDHLGRRQPATASGPNGVTVVRSADTAQPPRATTTAGTARFGVRGGRDVVRRPVAAVVPYVQRPDRRGQWRSVPNGVSAQTTSARAVTAGPVDRPTLVRSDAAVRGQPPLAAFGGRAPLRTVPTGVGQPVRKPQHACVCCGQRLYTEMGLYVHVSLSAGCGPEAPA